MRLALATDIHFNHASDPAKAAFVDAVNKIAADRLIIAGDIAESSSIFLEMATLAQQIACPIDFVLGNHDFYGAGIEDVRDSVQRLCNEHSQLTYLHRSNPIFTDSVAIVGVDGWGDGREGNYEQSPILLNDFRLIEDFRSVSQLEWRSLIEAQADESSDRLREKLEQVADTKRDIIVVTHVPPFCESCWYEGKTTDENWAPFFVCRAIGDCLRKFAASHQDNRVLVYCGHCHNAGEARILPNLHVSTGGAEYEKPRVDRVIDREAFESIWSE